MEDLGVLVSGIDYKLRKLLEQHKKIRQKNKELTAIVEEQEQIINHQKQLINELQERIKTVTITRTLASRSEINDAKNRIGDLVREIDRCIGLLNK